MELISLAYMIAKDIFFSGLSWIKVIGFIVISLVAMGIYDKHKQKNS